MGPLVRIALVFDYTLDYCRTVSRGIKRFAEAKPRWTFLSFAPDVRDLDALRLARPDGVIAHVFSASLAETLSRLRKPLVNVSTVVELPIPCVAINNQRVGELVAQHFLDRGFQHYAFVGHPRHFYAIAQQAAYRRIIGAAGYAVVDFRDARPFRTRGWLWAFDKEVHQWVRELPKPVAVFASTDPWGVQLAEVCRQEDIRVPEDLALVGVDNDSFLCELARPALSSVATPGERVGYEAAALLDRLLAGASPPREPIFLSPIGVVSRQSSDMLAIGDPDVAAALRFIREHGSLPIRVSDVAKEIPVSLRSLERRFRRAVGRRMFEEIRRVHLERAKTLLATTTLSMSDVAAQAGFSDNRHLCRAFQETGVTPSEYRRQYRY